MDVATADIFPHPRIYTTLYSQFKRKAITAKWVLPVNDLGNIEYLPHIS